MSKPVYDILVVEEYTDRHNRPRTMFHRAGVAFPNGNGSIDCRVTQGMALNGSFIIMPRKERQEEADVRMQTG